MQTRSSIIKILWSSVYVIVAVIGLRVTAETTALQQSPRRDRTVVRKPWTVEPVKVVAAKNKKKEKIEIGKPFDDDDDWLDGFSVTFLNGSDKIVTAVGLEIIFRREPGDNRNPAALDLYFGPSAISPEYLHRDPQKTIKPGQTGEILLGHNHYLALQHLLQTSGFSNTIN